MNLRSIFRLSSIVAASSLPLAVSNGQQDGEEIYELSPFSVESGDNEGYRATTTLAGTRLKTNLRDVGSSISILTDEIFDDTGATDAATILSYAANTEVAGIQGNFADPGFSGGRPNPSEQQRAPQNSQRVRGLAKASLTRNYFLTDIPFDNYNSDRVTINRGPNSLLFGIGEPGGVINNSVNGASLGRDFGELGVRIGERSSHRVTFNYNKVLLEERLAVRLSMLNEETEYQQRPTYEEDERYYFAFEGVLSKNEGSEFFDRTVIRGNYEEGNTKGIPPSLIPPAEGISNWFSLPSRSSIESITGSALPAYWDDGSWSPKLKVDTQWGADFNRVPAPVGDYITIQMPLVYRTVDAQTPSIGLASDPSIAGSIGRVVWVNGRDPGFLARFDTIGSRSPIIRGLYPGFTARTLNDTRIFDNRELSLAGTLNFVESDFDATNVVLEQTFLKGKAGIELAFDSQTYENFARLPFDIGSGSNNSSLDLWVDMNTHLSNQEPNPNIGRVAIRNRGTPERTTIIERDATRLTAFAEIDLTEKDGIWKHAGRHVFTGLYNEQEIDTDIRNHQLTWGDASTATDVSDILFSSKGQGRILVPSIYYVTDSLLDPSIQSFGDVRISNYIDAGFPKVGEVYKTHYNTRPPVINGDGSVGFMNEFITEETLWNGNRTLREIESQAASWQGYFFNGNVVGLLGWRRDEAKNFERVGLNPTQRLPSGELDPAGFALRSDPSTIVEEDTLTKSVVAHLPYDLPGNTEISVHYNESENFEPAGIRRDAKNQLIANPVGETKDYGFTLSFLDRRLSARFNWFETVNNFATTSIGGSSGGVAYIVNTSTGFYRRDADLRGGLTAPEATEGLFNTWPEFYSAVEALVPPDVWAAYEVDYNANNVDGFTSASIQGLTATQDFQSEGFELEVTGAITDNWNVFFNLSEQETVLTNVATPAFELVNEVISKATANGMINLTQSPSVGSSITWGQQLINNNLVPLAGAKTKEGTVSAEQRKWRANLTSTYNFDDGVLKGVGVGGALRWQDKIATGYPLQINSDGVQVPDLSQPFFGSDEINGDFWVNYSRPLMDENIDWKIQLNIRNLIGDQAMVRVITNPDGRAAITRNPNPKEIFLTNTFSF